MRFPVFAALLLVCLVLGLPQAFAAEAPRLLDVAAGRRPRLAVDPKGRLHAVFEGLTKSHDIFYTRSSDQGRHWSPPSNISKTPGKSSDPALAVDRDGNINVAWCDTTSGESKPDVFFSRSSDGGKTWSKAVDISETPGRSGEPDIAVGPDNSVHIVWVDNSAEADSPDIWYSSSRDGEAFTKPVDISLTPGVSSEPTVAVGADGLVHAAWVDTSSGKQQPDVYYARTTKNGSWTGAANMSRTRGICTHPDLISGEKGVVYLTWTDNTRKRTSPDVFFAYSVDGGTFSEPLNLSNTPGISSNPAVAADSAGRMVVVWTDTSHGSTSPDVWGVWSRDRGQTFSRAVNLSATPTVSRLPDVAVGQERMYVIWEEVAGNNSVVKFTSILLK